MPNWAMRERGRSVTSAPVSRSIGRLPNKTPVSGCLNSVTARGAGGLNRVSYFGIGNDSLFEILSLLGMRQARAHYPHWARLADTRDNHIDLGPFRDMNIVGKFDLAVLDDAFKTRHFHTRRIRQGVHSRKSHGVRAAISYPLAPFT